MSTLAYIKKLYWLDIAIKKYNNKNMKTKDIALSGVLLAVLIICSIITIPIGTVPISLSIFAVFVIGAILSPITAALVCLIYLILGLVGLPVFSNFEGGAAKLFGPTGGYLISYPIMAAIVSIIVKLGKKFPYYFFGMSTALFVCYISGATYMMISLKMTLKNVLSLGIIPFILPDIAKIVLAALLAYRLNTIIFKQKAGRPI